NSTVQTSPTFFAASAGPMTLALSSARASCQTHSRDSSARGYLMGTPLKGPWQVRRAGEGAGRGGRRPTGVQPTPHPRQPQAGRTARRGGQQQPAFSQRAAPQEAPPQQQRRQRREQHRRLLPVIVHARPERGAPDSNRERAPVARLLHFETCQAAGAR